MRTKRTCALFPLRGKCL